MVDLMIASYNVRGLGSAKRHREVFHYLHNKPNDVIFLHESHSSTRKP